MDDMVMTGLRRKLGLYKSAGLTEKAERTAAQIKRLEAAQSAKAAPTKPEPVVTKKADTLGGVTSTPPAVPDKPKETKKDGNDDLS